MNDTTAPASASEKTQIEGRRNKSSETDVLFTKSRVETRRNPRAKRRNAREYEEPECIEKATFPAPPMTNPNEAREAGLGLIKDIVGGCSIRAGCQKSKAQLILS